MSETADFIKTFKIEYDPIKGTIDYKNEGGLTYAEALGAIEYAKMMIMREWMDDSD